MFLVVKIGVNRAENGASYVRRNRYELEALFRLAFVSALPKARAAFAKLRSSWHLNRRAETR